VLRIAISNLLLAPALLFTKPAHGIFRKIMFHVSNYAAQIFVIHYNMDHIISIKTHAVTRSGTLIEAGINE